MSTFPGRYGAWGVVAGASEGLGAAFAEALAARGQNVVLIARRPAALAEIAARIRRRGREALEVPLDLLRDDALERLEDALDRAGIEDLGLLVHNAAYAPRGAFLEGGLADWERAIRLNALSPLQFCHRFGRRFQLRGGGGIVIMSSLAGFQGTPSLATYAATKAFGRVLAEALWHEMAPFGVHVLASCAGAIATPGFNRQAAQNAAAVSPELVAEETLDALGKGPVFVPNRRDRVAQRLLHALPRKLAVRAMAMGTKRAFKLDG